MTNIFADIPPKWGDSITLIIVSISLHAMFYFFIFGIFEVSLDSFLSWSDAGFYKQVAQRLYGGVTYAAQLTPYASRVFLGWPIIFGAFNLISIDTWPMFGLTAIFSGLVPAVFLHLTSEKRCAWLLVFFPPAWLLYSVYPMGEAVYLFLGLTATAVLLRDRFVLGGFLMGVMFGVRPYAIALGLGHLLLMIKSDGLGSTKRLIKYSLGGIVFPLLCAIINIGLYADPLHQLHVYAGKLSEMNISADAAARLGDPSGHWALPFVSLITLPLKVSTPMWKVIYIYSIAIIVLAVCILAIQCLFSKNTEWQLGLQNSIPIQRFDQCMAVWWLANSAMIFCTGPYWGFHTFDRYSIWALPAGIWLCRDYLRLSFVPQILLLISSIGMTVFTLFRRYNT